jgi:hypothetical protein
MHTDPEDLALLAIGEHIESAEAHVAHCEQCAAELAELSRLAQLARAADSPQPGLVEPPPAVWERTMAELQLAIEPQDSAATARPPDRVWQETIAQLGLNRQRSVDEDRRSQATRDEGRDQNGIGKRAMKGRGQRWGQIVIAAVLAAIIGFVGGVLLPRQFNQPKIISSAELTAQPKWLGSSGSAQIEVANDGSEILHITVNVTKPFDGNRQVWLATADLSQMRSVGYLNHDSGNYQIPAGLNLRAFTVVDVSAEPRPDPSPAHSDQSIVRGHLRP